MWSSSVVSDAGKEETVIIGDLSVSDLTADGSRDAPFSRSEPAMKG